MPRFGPYKFYSDSITLFFDSDSHTYLREFGAELVPQIGVTTALKIIDKSEYLIPWAAKRVAEKAAAIWPKVSDGLDEYAAQLPLDRFFNLLDEAKKAPREILQDAGNVGEEAHRALEDAINFALRTNNGIVERLVSNVKDPRAKSCCTAALDWMHKHSVVWIGTERKIYSKEYEYAGTLDGIAKVSSCADLTCCSEPFCDTISVIDWKSSNFLQLSYRIQTAAYERAFEEETKTDISDRFILRLGKEDGKFEPWHILAEDFEVDFRAFRNCLDLGRTYQELKEITAEAKRKKKIVKKKQNEQNRNEKRGKTKNKNGGGNTLDIAF